MVSPGQEVFVSDRPSLKRLMSQIIDRRLNGRHKNAVNRQRFIRRYRRQIKEAVADAIGDRSIRDIDSGEEVSIPSRDISEPTFRHGQGGEREIILPGNEEFIAGDQIQRPQGGGGRGDSQASNEGEGSDEFAFQLSREEFLDFFFDDLALPDLVKTQLATITETRQARAGYSQQGIPANINIVRSLQGALARRMALGGGDRRRLRELEESLRQLDEAGTTVTDEQRDVLLNEIQTLRQRLKRIPFIDDFDLRYNHHIDIPKPITQAVMFCLMDVSGSMDEERKDIAKRFFILLYLFLTRQYERIELVFIRHHTSASEVDEETFFHARETGGTVVSSALRLMDEIIRDRYADGGWNLYAAQASDGDNWGDDSPLCRQLLDNHILPRLQYFAYVEIGAQAHQSLWQEYCQVSDQHDHFAMQAIATAADIYPVFRQLFRKQNA